MPHVKISMYPGRTLEQKKKLTDRIVKDLMEVTGSKESSISVVIEEISPDDWNKEIVEKEIKPKEALMYKKPGYKY